MARITVEDCLKKIDNQYDLVLLAKERTVQLNAGSPMLVEEDNDITSLYVTAGVIGGFILLSSIIAMLILRRRKRLADIDLIDSWGVFGTDSKEYLEEELEL